MKIFRISGREYVPASHENPAFPGVLKKVLLAASDISEGRLQMVNWALLPEGRTFQPHYHQDMEEIFIILTGASRITVERQTAELGPGDAVVIPIGSTHHMTNIGSGDVEYIALGISQGRGGKTVVV